MTFTAARVKQEIAKEGILPWSLIIAPSYPTPWALLKSFVNRSPETDDDQETAPTAAFALHWFTSVLLIVLVSPVADPRTSYDILVSLYSYTIITLLGCWVSLGLIKIKLGKNTWRWQVRRRYKPWLSPGHVIAYAAATAFMLVASFVPPAKDSPFHHSTSNAQWYVIPAIGITAPFWGVLWYWGLLIYEWKIGRQLVVSREAYWMQDPDCECEYVQRAEIVEHDWPITIRSTSSQGSAAGAKGEDAGFGADVPMQGE